MAQLVGLLALLRRLITREFRSFSSVGLNNLLFCVLLIAQGSRRPQSAFWGTLLFQILLLAPLLVTFSVDTQQRLPQHRVATWLLTKPQWIGFSALSFALNPLFLILFGGYWFWMGLPTALAFVCLGFVVHLLVFLASRLPVRNKATTSFTLPRIAWNFGGIALQMWRDLRETLDFWAAVLIAVTGTLYRAFGHAADRYAFPVLALIVAVAMSTIAQRMFDLDDGRALLRYRLLPLSGWKVIATVDAVFLFTVGLLVSCLSLKAGCTCALVSLAVGRYPSINQRVSQRRWRFIGGDPRFGLAQVVLGGFAGLAAVRVSLYFSLAAVILYAASLLWGQLLWKRKLSA